MARSATTIDAFAALAEPRRRQVLDSLAHGEQTVSTMVKSLRWPQPQVSKHLSVLRQVGLVNVRRDGRERLYSVNGPKLKPVHDWIKVYEKFWDHQLDRIKQRAEEAARAGKTADPQSKG
jgi:DNA-binding transcriptional ArsR family regulator